MPKQDFEQLFRSIQPKIEQDIVSFKVLYDLIEQLNPTKILEIGFCFGGSSRMFQNLVPEDTGVVVSIEFAPIPEEDMVPRENTNSYIIVGSSQDPSVLLTAALEAPYDALFIDGDHSYAGVKSDYEQYAPLVRPGGIIAFHDHGHGPILQFWNELEVPGKVVIQGSLTIGYFYKV